MQVTPEIEQAVVEWAKEVRVLLEACRRLVEYYGTDEEGVSCGAAVEAPLWFVSALEQIAAGAEVDTTKGPPPSKLVCSELVASTISPPDLEDVPEARGAWLARLVPS